VGKEGKAASIKRIKSARRMFGKKGDEKKISRIINRGR